MNPNIFLGLYIEGLESFRSHRDVFDRLKTIFKTYLNPDFVIFLILDLHLGS